MLRLPRAVRHLAARHGRDEPAMLLVSGWSGRYLLARRDSTFRATAMALLALYFVAVMEALLYIQRQIGQI